MYSMLDIKIWLSYYYTLLLPILIILILVFLSIQLLVFIIPLIVLIIQVIELVLAIIILGTSFIYFLPYYTSLKIFVLGGFGH